MGFPMPHYPTLSLCTLYPCLDSSNIPHSIINVMTMSFVNVIDVIYAVVQTLCNDSEPLWKVSAKGQISFICWELQCAKLDYFSLSLSNATILVLSQLSAQSCPCLYPWLCRKHIVNHLCEWHAELSFENKCKKSDKLCLAFWFTKCCEQTMLCNCLPPLSTGQGWTYLAGTWRNQFTY